MALLISYLIVGVYVSILGYTYDPPPSETEDFTRLAMGFINVFGFILLMVIWPLAMWKLAKEYPGREDF